MYAVGRLSSYISQGVYTVSAPFHPFGGAVDIIVVEQPDGSFKSSPWYVTFGKFQGFLKSKEKIVSINVNGEEADFHMYLDQRGEAYFLREVEGEEIDSTVFSPPSSGDETDEQSHSGGTESSKNLDSPIDFNSGKILVRTNSRRSRILGLMFGRKSMKQNNRQEEGGDIAMERLSSLERAEIAADLLEVKWSTNLPTDVPRRTIPAAMPNNDAQVNDDHALASLLMYDSMEKNLDHSFIQEATGPYNGIMSNSSMSGIEDTECSNGLNSPARTLGSDEHNEDTSMSGTCILDDKLEVLSQPSARISNFDLENAMLNNRVESDFVTSVPFVQNSHIDKHERGYNMQHIVGGASDERVHSSSAGVPNEESENLFLYCEASANLGIGVSCSEQGSQTLNLSQEEFKEAEVHVGVLSDTEKLISEVNSEPEFTSIMKKDNPNNIKTPSDEDSDKFRRTSEAEILELIHQETATERLSEGNSLQTELVEAFESLSQVNGFPHPCITGIIDASFEESSTAPRSGAQVVSDNLVHIVEEVESQGVCISSHRSNSISLGQEEEDLGEEDEMNNLHNASHFVDVPQGSSTDFFSTKAADSRNVLSESAGEDQFLFSDIDDFVTSEVPCKETVFPESLEIENNPLVTMDNSDDLNGSSNMDQRSHLSSVKLIQESSTNAFENLLEESKTKSIPLSIPRSWTSADKEVEWRIKSLPNFLSHIDNLEISGVLHPLSHSLDSHSERLRQELLRKDVSSASTSDFDTKHKRAEDDPITEDTQIWEEFKNKSTNSAVEISLCKHLLYEGMGADAASQAFEAEKVDLEKCSSLGPQLMKNDSLIVRVGGRYYPWVAAASYILEMLSLGHDQIFESEGMIAVDRVEKTIEGKPSITSVPSGGSWTLWPFSRRRSITMNPVQSTPNGTKDSDILNASGSFRNATENESPLIAKVTKMKVKSIVPTSEQLRTLHLKEGRNVITFTFSTAMLGKQQVDARIYLWKWNTRIVISDVDGTITRSDVLGQFMPLVGKDWSHIGVTHMFSAIKENGYQLLFLSARAISQAHLTRQFLFNLKQDGKALPDGPVVISPDGLFPSLFREVIRRAPHEFKIACLKDIRALFPSDCSPFYAGFGNRITDEISYLKLGIPKGKIFIINAKGEVAVNRRFDRKSYTSIHALVDGMFPATTSAEQEDFNSWNYWKTPLPEIKS